MILTRNNDEPINDQKIINQLRGLGIDMIHEAGSGHPGITLDAAPILYTLYAKHLRFDPSHPDFFNRDRFVMSAGHGAALLYACLSMAGFDLSMEDLKAYRHLNSKTPGHPELGKTPGVDMTTGSLGQGISAAVGMALSGKISNKNYTVYTILGDGEIQEGQVWEAAMFAAHYKLDNLVAIVDNNNLQIDGKVSDVMSVYPIDEKFAAFGWNVAKCDAHDFDSIDRAFENTKEKNGKPWVIIQKSVKGKGVSFMENQASWHGSAPNDEQYAIAMEDLDKISKELEGK